MGMRGNADVHANLTTSVSPLIAATRCHSQVHGIETLSRSGGGLDSSCLSFLLITVEVQTTRCRTSMKMVTATIEPQAARTKLASDYLLDSYFTVSFLVSPM